LASSLPAYQEPLTKHLADVLGTDGVLVLPTTADTAPLSARAIGGQGCVHLTNRPWLPPVP